MVGAVHAADQHDHRDHHGEQQLLAVAQHQPRLHRGLGGDHPRERRGAGPRAIEVERVAVAHDASSRPVSSRNTSSRVRWPRVSDSGSTSLSSHQRETTARLEASAGPVTSDAQLVEQRDLDPRRRARARSDSGASARERPGHHQPDRRRVPAAGELERRTAGDQAAVVDDVDPVGEALGLVHVVRGEHDGDAGGAQLLEQLPGGTPGGGVHAGGRLVDEHDLRTADDRHRQAEPLLLAAGEPSVRRPAAVAEAEPVGEQPSRSSGWACSRATCRSISSARTPLQAPPPWSITPMRGSRARRSRTGSSPSTRTVPACGRAVALGGLERGGLARRRWARGRR